MSKDIVLVDNNENKNQQESVTRINGDVYLKAGTFCRANTDITITKMPNIPIGEVLLISKLKFAHNIIHAVCVRVHPDHIKNASRENYEFLFDDFLEKFSLIPQEEGLAIRKRELERIQNGVNQYQKEFFETQSDPEKMMQIALEIYSKRIESNDLKMDPQVAGNIDAVALIGNGLDTTKLEAFRDSLNKPMDLIKIQSEWLQEQTANIQKLAEGVFPFIIESAEVARAQTSEIEKTINDTMKSIKNMDLYLGTNVEVLTIVEGQGAAPEEKLTLVQEVLFADAELSLFHECVETFDGRDKSKLWKQFIEHPEFIDHIFPAQRCALLMRTNAKAKDYGDLWENHHINLMNMRVFLLVRNGANVYAVFSPISSHISASRLFPAQDEIERHLFQDVKSDEPIQINIDNLNYSDALNVVECEILHYKRFLLLIAGLDHRLNLFGKFYTVDNPMQIFYPEFQKKYFNFINDASGEGMLPLQEESRPTVRQYIEESNRLITAGTHIIIDTEQAITLESAPSCFSRHIHYKQDQTCYPKNSFELVRVQRDKNGFFVKIPVKTRSYSDRKDFDARVALNLGSYAMGAHLSLSTITYEDIQFYLNSRQHRKDFIDYIKIFKFAKEFLIERERNLAPLVAYLDEALNHIPDCTLKGPYARKKAILLAINSWSVNSANIESIYDITTPKNKRIQKAILKQLYYHSSNNEKLINACEKAAQDMGVKPFALNICLSGEMKLYTDIQDSEKVLELGQDNFTQCYAVSIDKSEGVTLEPINIIKFHHIPIQENKLKVWEENTQQLTSGIYRTLEIKRTLIDYLKLGGEFMPCLFDVSKMSKDMAWNILESIDDAYRFNMNGDSIYLPFFLSGQYLVRCEVKCTKNLIKAISLISKGIPVQKMPMGEFSLDVSDLNNFSLDQFSTDKLFLGSSYYGRSKRKLSSRVVSDMQFKSDLLIDSYIDHIIDNYRFKTIVDDQHVFFSCFDHALIFAGNGEIDRLLGNPVRADIQNYSLNLEINSTKNLSFDKFINSTVTLFIGDYKKITQYKINNKVVDPFENNMQYETSNESYGCDGIYTQSDLDILIEHYLKAEIVTEWSSEKQKLKDSLDFAQVSQLSDLKIVHQEDDLVVYSKKFIA